MLGLVAGLRGVFWGFWALVEDFADFVVVLAFVTVLAVLLDLVEVARALAEALPVAGLKARNLRVEKKMAKLPAKISSTTRTNDCEMMISVKSSLKMLVAMSLMMPVLGTKAISPSGGR